MKHLLIALLTSGLLSAQQLKWIDTLIYNDNTEILSLMPHPNGKLYAFGYHGTAYSNPDNSSSRLFLLELDPEVNTITFLDSTIRGIKSCSQMVLHGDHIYFAVVGGPVLGGVQVEYGTYLVKYHISGQVIWCKKQIRYTNEIGAITISTGGIINVSYSGYNVAYNVDGDILPVEYPYGAAGCFDFNGNFYTKQSFSISKFNPFGDSIGFYFTEQYASFIPDEFENIYVVYGVPITYSSGMVKLDKFGNQIWKKDLPLSASTINVNQYNIYVSGMYGPPTWSEGVSIWKLDPNTGATIWETKIPFSDNSYIPSAFSSSDGLVYLASKRRNSIWDTRLVCIKDQSFIPVTTGIKEDQIKNSSLKVVPNPSSGNVTLYLPEELHGNIKVQLTDVAGRVVLQNEFENNLQQNSVTLPFRDLSAGIYNVQLFSDEHISASGRLVIEQ